MKTIQLDVNLPSAALLIDLLDDYIGSTTTGTKKDLTRLTLAYELVENLVITLDGVGKTLPVED